MAKRKTQTKKKTAPDVTPERIKRSIASRFNPIRNLTPATLSTQLDSFAAGYLANAARTWDKMEQRDDVLKSVAPKRKKAVSRHDYEILVIEDSPAAEAHKETLEHFYNNLTTTSAIDENSRGGFRLLVRQMMDAVGKFYAVHEIVWVPSDNKYTAEFRHVPLWFFENTTGKLRYLQDVGAVAGVDMPPGEWMVTAGDGLMETCSVAYMYKHLPLRDWLVYSERHGMPGIRGVTDAKKGTDQWNDMVAAVNNFAADYAAVMSRSESIEPINIESKGQLPYPKLVERMDRAMASIWRGADLSTMSSGAGQGTGASLQGREADILEEDDADMISEVLNQQVDPFVIQYVHGDDVPLAYIKISVPTRRDVKQDLQVDEMLLKAQVEMSKADLRERYNRPAPDSKDELAVPPVDSSVSAGGAGTGVPASHSLALSNADRVIEAKGELMAERLQAASIEDIAQAQARELAEVRKEMERIMTIDDDEFRTNALRNLQAELPKMLADMNRAAETMAPFEKTLNAATVNGFVEAAAQRRQTTDNRLQTTDR